MKELVDINKRSLSKGDMIKYCIVFLIVFSIVVITARYATEEDFRYMIDKNILKKIVDEESSSVSQIELNQDMNPFIFAYDKYINVLSKNVLNQYNKYGTQVGKINVNISVPVYDTNDKYLALADLNGQKIYMISGSSILWEQNLEGNISKVSINKNGYVSVVVTGTTYKTVIVVIDPEGKILFRYFLSNSYVPTISISNNNKYLAIGEIDYKGSIISSTVKILSIDLAQKEPDNAIINSYKSDNNANQESDDKNKFNDLKTSLRNKKEKRRKKEKREKKDKIEKDEGERRYRKYDEYKVLEFLEKNKNKQRIDLHGFKLSESMIIVKKKLEEMEQIVKENKVEKLLIIVTGRGNHSPGNKPVLRPNILRWLKSKNYNVNEKDPGALYVLIQ